MNLGVLRYFLTVAKEESISRAADFLHITQPTLSRQLMELEKEFGTRLLIRGNRKITLTNKGTFLQKRAKEILNLVDKTEAELKKPDEIVGGEICIGAGESDAFRFVAKAIKNFQKRYPNVRFRLFSGIKGDVTERLEKGTLDFGVIIGSYEVKKYNYIKIPATDEWGLLMRKDAPLASCGAIEPKDLLDAPVIAGSSVWVRNEISEWLGQDMRKLNIIATFNLINNAAIMVEEGIGYALCLDKLVNTMGNSSLCFKPFEPRLRTSLHFIWKKYSVFSKASDLFLADIADIL
jgi:DNA-binding transcriptional LysR family regulator